MLQIIGTQVLTTRPSHLYKTCIKLSSYSPYSQASPDTSWLHLQCSSLQLSLFSCHLPRRPTSRSITSTSSPYKQDISKFYKYEEMERPMYSLLTFVLLQAPMAAATTMSYHHLTCPPTSRVITGHGAAATVPTLPLVEASASASAPSIMGPTAKAKPSMSLTAREAYTVRLTGGAAFGRFSVKTYRRFRRSAFNLMKPAGQHLELLG